MREIADAMFASPDYADRDEARNEKIRLVGRRRRRPNWTPNSTST